MEEQVEQVEKKMNLSTSSKSTCGAPPLGGAMKVSQLL